MKAVDLAKLNSAKSPHELQKLESKATENGLDIQADTFDPGDTVTGLDVVRKAGFDLSVWKVVSCSATHWQVAVKLKEGDSWHVETKDLWRVNVKCSRRLPEFAQEASCGFVDRVSKLVSDSKFKFPAVRRKKKKSPCVLEIAIADIHAGKLALDGSWSLKQFERVYSATVDHMIDECADKEIAHIVLPMGNDMLNVDTAMMTTTRGTPQQSGFTFSAMYESAKWAMVRAVERCRQVADVSVVHVPGNHDWSSSFHLCSMLDAVFQKTKGVTVDISDRHGGARKYWHQGNVLLGWTHGNNEKVADLPGLMAVEEPQWWANSTCREFHIGHRHHRVVRKKKVAISGDVSLQEIGGVVVRQLPSLSPDDHYHKIQGYVGSARCNEAYLFDLKHGLVRTVTVGFDRLVV